MNRLFDTPENLSLRGLRAQGPDWLRAQQIASMLRDVDVLLDLHSTSTPCEPFAIVRDVAPSTLELLVGMPLSRIDYAYQRVLPGCTMQCVHEHGGVGITVECGQHGQAARQAATVAERCAVALLRNLSMLGPGKMQGKLPRERLELVHRGLVLHPPSLRYAPGIQSGVRVSWGALIAEDMTGEYRAPTQAQTSEIVGRQVTGDGLEVLMVTPGSRLTNVRPHDAFLLGLPCAQPEQL